METVTKTLELMAAAAVQGVAMNDIEAAILLGYLEGNDYCLMMGENRKLWLRDNQDGGRDQNDYQCTIRGVIELCKELCEEILLEEESRDTTQPDYIMELRKDGMILGQLLERAAAVIPPKEQGYKVVVVEHLRKVIPVNAVNWADAELKVREAYDKGEIVLSADDFAGVTFSLGG